MDPVATTVGTMVIPKGLKHPHAAMLLADFILSEEGQRILSGAGYFPSRPDVPTDDDIKPVTDALKTVSEEFVSPESLNKYTQSSEDMIKSVFGQ